MIFFLEINQMNRKDPLSYEKIITIINQRNNNNNNNDNNAAESNTNLNL